MLLAPASNATSSVAGAGATTKNPKAISKTKPKKTKSESPVKKVSTTQARSVGIFKPTPVSPALSQFLGTGETTRYDAVREIWIYIKSNNLQNPADMKEIFCDDKLKQIFDGKEKVGFLEIAKLLSPHFAKN